MLSSISNGRSTSGMEAASVSDSSVVQPLVRAAQGGDMKAFERLYRLHCSRVFGLCLRMIRERDAAEDCVQQTFIKAWRNLDQFEHRSAFSSWLHGIAVNAVLSHKRANKAWLQFDDAYSSHEEFDAAEAVAEHETKRVDDGDLADLERALKSLPDGARYVLVLQALYGYSHEEVAAMLGIAVGTCKAQLHRARRILRHKMQITE